MTTFVNGSATPKAGTDTVIATIAGGPYDLIDAFVSGGVGAQLLFKIFATVAGVRSQVAFASYNAANAGQRLLWTRIGQQGASAPLQASGTSYDLTVNVPNAPQQGMPAVAQVQATLAGTLAGAVAAETQASGTAAVPANGEAQIATAPGYQQLADVSVVMTNLPPVQMNLYADCGAGSVRALIASAATGGADQIEAVMVGQSLPVATNYYLTAKQSNGAAAVNVTASLSTYNESAVAGAATITPGPQITTLRSVVPTSPTSVVWASTGYVDFVADCGADPTGVADCGPALTVAFTLLSALAANPDIPATTVILLIPPGIYKQTTEPVVWNFAGVTTPTTVIVRGCGDASIILEDQNPGKGLNIFMAGGGNIIIENLSWLGATDDDVTADCTIVCELNPGNTGQATIRSCRIIGIIASLAHFYCLGRVYLEDVDFGLSACNNAAGAMVFGDGTTGCQALRLKNCRFSDVNFLNGKVYIHTKVGSGVTYVALSGSQALSSASSNEGLSIDDCFFDEGTQFHVKVTGTSLAIPVNGVRIRNCKGNTPIHGAVGTGAAYALTNVLCAEIDQCIGTNATGNVANPWIALTGVAIAKIRAVSILPTANANFLTADNTSEYVELDTCSFPASGMQGPGGAQTSQANVTRARVQLASGFWVWCELGIVGAGGNLALGQAVKYGAAGAGQFITIATTDDDSNVHGFAAAAAVVGANVLVALTNQRVTGINDGAGAIAVGDPITISAATAGELKKQAAGGRALGTAQQAAVAVAGTTFDFYMGG